VVMYSGVDHMCYDPM